MTIAQTYSWQEHCQILDQLYQIEWLSIKIGEHFPNLQYRYDTSEKIEVITQIVGAIFLNIKEAPCPDTFRHTLQQLTDVAKILESPRLFLIPNELTPSDKKMIECFTYMRGVISLNLTNQIRHFRKCYPMLDDTLYQQLLEIQQIGPYNPKSVAAGSILPMPS